MEWQQHQDPETSVEDVFEITLDVNPESMLEGDLEYVEDSEGEEYPIFPPPSQELLHQQPTFITDKGMEAEAYAGATIENNPPKSPATHQEMDIEEATEDGDGEEEDQTKGESWFNANGQMVMTKVPWAVMMQFIRNYLKSVASSQGSIWPVPNMNRSVNFFLFSFIPYNYYFQSPPGALAFPFIYSGIVLKSNVAKYLALFS